MIDRSEHLNELGARRRAWEVGRKGHDTYEWAACSDCEKPRWTIVLRGRPASAKCKRCGLLPFNESRRQTKSPAWRGGRRTDNGYIKVYLPDGHPLEAMRMPSGRYVLEHRLVMAQSLGRCLRSDEIVHHKDGVRNHNDIANLELTARGSHSKQHSQGYRDGYASGYLDGLTAAQKETA